MPLEEVLAFDPTLVVVGALVGLTVGLTGVGSGSLLTPLLLLLGVRPVDAVGASLLNSILMKGVGTAQHERQGTVSRHLLLPLLAGAIPGAAVASLAVVYASIRAPAATDLFLRVAIGIALALAAATLLRQILVERRFGRVGDARPVPAPAATAFTTGPEPEIPRRLQIATAGFGLLTGVTVALTSIGSGSFLMPFLVLVFASRVGLHRLVGTDVALGAVVGSIAGFVYLASGVVQVGPLVWLLAGSVPGVLVGSRVTFRLDLNGARAAISSVTLLVGIVLIYGGFVNG